jgi:hypothetical protein
MRIRIAVAAVIVVLAAITLIGIWKLQPEHAGASASATTGPNNRSTPPDDDPPTAPKGGPPPSMTIPPPAGHANPIVTGGIPGGTAGTGIWATAVAVDDQGRVWAGVEDMGLSVYEPHEAAWANFHDAPGGGDPIIALACDRQGRVWAGHAYNGVSVFNGAGWQSYGLLDGPLGERVNDIEVSPVDGDVWMATNRGITRYSVATDAWSYYTRGDGLPSDDMVGIAIDRGGTIYAATADNGVAIALPTKTGLSFKSIQTNADNRGRVNGQGLASNWCNDVRVTRSGVVFVGSTDDLSYSRDSGSTWQFIRGVDWREKALGATKPPPLENESAVGVMAEDVVTSLGEDSQGRLLIGHLRVPADVLDPDSLKVVDHLAAETVCAYGFAKSRGTTYVASFGKGVVTNIGQVIGPEETIESAADAKGPAWLGRAEPAAFPKPAPPPDVQALVALRATAAAMAGKDGELADVLGTDWVTGGDCIGRYGWDLYALPSYGASHRAPGYAVREHVGPHVQKGDGVFTYYATTNSDDPRHLFVINGGKRMQGEWNDASWQKKKYPYTWEGPDLWFDVNVPAGVHRVSLYLINNDGHSPTNRCRDYLIELKGEAADAADPDAGPTHARARARRFGEGFYVQFVVSEGAYRIKLGRNGGHAVKASGLFIDRLDVAMQEAPAHSPSGPPLMCGLDFRPKWDGNYDATGKPALEAAARLLMLLDTDRSRTAPVDQAYRLLAYRAIAAERNTEVVAANVRYRLPVWTVEDRRAFTDAMAEGHARLLKQNPHMDDEK